MTSPRGSLTPSLPTSSTPTACDVQFSEDSLYVPVRVVDGLIDLYGFTIDAHNFFMHAGLKHVTIADGSGTVVDYVDRRWLEAYYGELLRRRTLGG